MSVVNTAAPRQPHDDTRDGRSRARLKRLLGLARPEVRVLALGTVFLLLASAMGLAYPQAIRVILDRALGGGRPGDLDRAALAMGVMFAVQSVAGGLRYYLFSTAGERIVLGLREHLYGHLMAQEVGFFDGQRTGELLSRLTSDTGVIQNTVSVNISMALRHGTQTVGGLALLFWVSPVLAGVMLLAGPGVAGAAVWFGRRIRILSRAVQDRLADANRVAEETLAGIRTVRAFSREPDERARYGSAIEKAFRSTRRRIISIAWFSSGASLGGYGAVAAVLWFGGRMVVGGQLSAGELTSFILYTLIVAFSLGSLADLWTDLMRASGAADRVFDLLDRESTIPNEGGRTLERVRGEVRFEGVGFAYPTRPDVPVLRDFSVTLSAGEVVALVGPSGSGKSTVAALLSRFYDPVDGTVWLDGTPLTELDPSWLRSQIGVVAQEPVLFSTSVEQNIRYGRRDASRAEIEAAARAAHAHEFVTAFPEGYATPVGERGVQLSGGQKQRVAIARAILKNPPVLILDEATSALDAESEHLVQDALDHLQEGRTTLVIAHRLSTVKRATRVAVLEHGRLMQIGTHTDLMDDRRGLYRRLVERQLTGT